MTELAIVRFVHIVACIFAFGLMTFVFCLPRDDGIGDSARIPMGRALRNWALASSAVALASWVLWLLALTPVMSGLPRAQAWSWPILDAVIAETGFGTVWLVRGGLLLLLHPLLWASRDLAARRARFAAALLLCGLALAFVAGAGHASREAGVNGDLHLFGDALHLLGAGAWLGGLPPLILMFGDRYAAPSRERHGKDSAVMLNRFSGLAVWAVGALALGAAINAWFMIPSVAAVWSRTYGWMLLAKIALLCLMLLLAAHNRWILAPRLTRESASVTGTLTAATLRRNILVELGAGTIILAVVAVMGITSP